MRDLTTFLTYSGLSTILFLILLLSQTWKQRKANKILSGILLSFLFLFLTYASSYLEWTNAFTFISPIGYITPFAIGALIRQYIKTIYTSQVDQKELFKSLLPFGLALLLFSVPQYILGPPSEDSFTSMQILLLVIPLLGVIHLGIYLYKSSLLLKKYRRRVKENYANISSLDLKWLSIWIRGFILFLVIDTASSIITFASDQVSLLYINLFYLVILIWYVGFYGIKQTQVFLLQSFTQSSPPEAPPKERPKLVSASFDCNSQEFVLLKTNLEALFVEKELFKKSHLSLKETAELLNVSDKKLSHFFNTCLSTSFYEYVNAHRIAYFRGKLESGAADQFTLLAIAFESGFNSKATFNRVFKQQTGMTPKEFRKTLE